MSEQGSLSHLSLLTFSILSVTARERRRKRQRFGPKCVIALRQNADPFDLAPSLAKAKRIHRHQKQQ